jgi:hypothetical protein
MTIYVSNLKPSPYDARDYKYIANTTSLPRRVDLREHAGSIEDQETIGSCTANATVSALELMAQRAGKFNNLSRLFLYFTTREYENRIGQDGAVLRDAMKMANQRGVSLEMTYPYDVSKVDSLPPTEVYKEAKQRLVSSYEAVTLNPDSFLVSANNIKAAIAAGHPVVVALKLRRRVFSISGPLSEHNKIDTTQPGYNDWVGNHAVTIVGYDDDLSGGMFIIENSWGTQWGDQGYWGYSYSLVNEIYEAWVVKGFEEIGSDFTEQRTRINQLYVALFGRAAERGGMDYWASQLTSKSDAQVAQEMYDCEPSRVYYPSHLTNEEIITRFYTNVLGRSPDAGGLSYWTAQLDSGLTKGQVIINMLDAVTGYTGIDSAALQSKSLLANKVAVSLYFSVSLKSDDLFAASAALNQVTHSPATITAAKVSIINSLG